MSVQTRHGRGFGIGQFAVTIRIPTQFLIDDDKLDHIRFELDGDIISALIIHPPTGIQRRELDGVLAVQRGGLRQCVDDVVRGIVRGAVVVDDLDEVFRFLPDNYWEENEDKEVFDTDAVSAFSESASDTSMKLNGVEDGVRSYSRMVNLLLDYYFPPEE